MAITLSFVQLSFNYLRDRILSDTNTLVQKRAAYNHFVTLLKQNETTLGQNAEIVTIVSQLTELSNAIKIQEKLAQKNSFLNKGISFVKHPPNLFKGVVGAGVVFFGGWAGVAALTTIVAGKLVFNTCAKERTQVKKNELEKLIDLIDRVEEIPNCDLKKAYDDFHKGFQQNFNTYKDLPQLPIFQQKVAALYQKAYGTPLIVKAFIPPKEMLQRLNTLINENQTDVDYSKAFQELYDVFTEHYSAYNDDVSTCIAIADKLIKLYCKANHTDKGPESLIALARPIIGIANQSANCWVNSLIQFIVRNAEIMRFLKHSDFAYLNDAKHYGFRNPQDVRAAQNLLNTLKKVVLQYEQDRTDPRQLDLCQNIFSSEVRDAFKAFNYISDTSQECPYEALRRLMSLLPTNNPLVKTMHTFRYYNVEGQPVPNDISLICRTEADGRKIAFSKGPVDPQTGIPIDTDWGNIRIFLPKDEENFAITPPPENRPFYKQVFNGQEKILHYFSNSDGGEVGRYTTDTGQRHPYPLIGETRVFDGPLPSLFVTAVRFNYDDVTGTIQKLNSPVDIPLEPIQIPGSAFNGADPSSYELEAVMCHDGNYNGGHYYNFIKVNQEWYISNDGHTTKVDDLEAMKATMSTKGYVWQLNLS